MALAAPLEPVALAAPLSPVALAAKAPVVPFDPASTTATRASFNSARHASSDPQYTTSTAGALHFVPPSTTITSDAFARTTTHWLSTSWRNRSPRPIPHARKCRPLPHASVGFQSGAST